jgi:hypothetical protein
MRSAGSHGRVQCAQFGGLPGVIAPVQAVEFAQYGGDGLASLLGSLPTTMTSTRVPNT